MKYIPKDVSPAKMTLCPNTVFKETACGLEFNTESSFYSKDQYHSIWISSMTCVKYRSGAVKDLCWKHFCLVGAWMIGNISELRSQLNVSVNAAGLLLLQSALKLSKQPKAETGAICNWSAFCHNQPTEGKWDRAVLIFSSSAAL